MESINSLPRNIRRWWEARTPSQKALIVIGAIIACVGLAYYLQFLVTKLAATAGVSVAEFAIGIGDKVTAICNDGWLSHAANCQGQCSHHFGVAVRVA